MYNKSVFHSNFHFSNHFSQNDGENINSATDPIASYNHPFNGNFYVAATIDTPKILSNILEINSFFGQEVNCYFATSTALSANIIQCNSFFAPVCGLAFYGKSLSRPNLAPYTAAIVFDTININNLKSSSFQANSGNIYVLNANNINVYAALTGVNISANTFTGAQSAALLYDLFSLMSDKQILDHTHSQADIIIYEDATLTYNLSNFDNLLQSKAYVFHGHNACDIIDCSPYYTLSASLTAKADMQHQHSLLSVTGLSQMLDEHTTLLNQLSAAVSTKSSIHHTHTVSYINDNTLTNLIEDLSALSYRRDGSSSPHTLNDINNNIVKQTLADHYHSVFQIKDLRNYINNILSLSSVVNSIALSGHLHNSSEFDIQLDSLSTHLVDLSTRIVAINAQIDEYQGKALVPLSQDQKDRCFYMNETVYRKYELTRLNPIVTNKDLNINQINTQHVILEGSTQNANIYTPHLSSKFLHTDTVITQQISSEETLITTLSTNALSVNELNTTTLISNSSYVVSLSDNNPVDAVTYKVLNTTADTTITDLNFAMDLHAFQYKYTGIGGVNKAIVKPLGLELFYSELPLGIPGGIYVNGVLSGSLAY